MKNLIIGILFFLLAQILTWFHIQGQFIWDYFKENPWVISLMGIPISYFYIVATKYTVDGMDGLLWPTRFIGFGRKESSIIAVIMSLPIMISSSIYLIFKIFGGVGFDLTISIIISVLLSFIASYLSIIIIVEFIERIKIYPYVAYRVFISLLILLFVN